MYRHDSSLSEQVHGQPQPSPFNIEGHPLSLGPGTITPATPGLSRSSDAAENTSNAEWVMSNQRVTEFTENWAECYGLTEGRTDSRKLYDFNVLAQECANLMNPGLVASANHSIRIKDNMQHRMEMVHGPGATPPADISPELDKLKIFKRHRSEGVSILKNSVLQNVVNTPKDQDYGWIQARNQAAMTVPENWVKSDVTGRGQGDASNPYTFNTLTQECENLNSGNALPHDVNVNELSCYFDDILHIPKKITEWANRMYS